MRKIGFDRLFVPDHMRCQKCARAVDHLFGRQKRTKVKKKGGYIS